MFVLTTTSFSFNGTNSDHVYSIILPYFFSFYCDKINTVEQCSINMYNLVKKATANLIKKVKIHLIYFNFIEICLPYKKHTCNLFQADSLPYMVVMNKNF